MRAERLDGRVRRCVPDPERVQQPVAADVRDVVVWEVDKRRRRAPEPAVGGGLVARGGEAPVEVERERREVRAEVEDPGHVQRRDAQQIEVQQVGPVRGEKGDGVGLVDAAVPAVER